MGPEGPVEGSRRHRRLVAIGALMLALVAGVVAVGVVTDGGRAGTTTDADSASLTCAEGGDCVNGDIGPGGGLVFAAYPNGFSSSGSDCDTDCHYLEVWTGSFPQKAWCANGSASSGQVSGVAQQIGRGMSNTQLIADNCEGGMTETALAFANNGKDDWYVPAWQELNKVLYYLNNNGIAGYSDGDYFLNSYQDYATGDMGFYGTRVTKRDKTGTDIAKSYATGGRLVIIRAF